MDRPIEYLKPGQCPSCGARLELYYNEHVFVKIDTDGIPYDTESEIEEYEGFCPNCCRSFRMYNDDMVFYVDGYPIAPKPKEYKEPENPFGSYKEDK